VQVGDLVKIHKRCKSSGRMAIIIEMGWINDCTIVYLDTNEKVQAIKANLEVVSASR
jgi:hypothetical protein